MELAGIPSKTIVRAMEISNIQNIARSFVCASDSSSIFFAHSAHISLFAHKNVDGESKFLLCFLLRKTENLPPSFMPLHTLILRTMFYVRESFPFWFEKEKIVEFVKIDFFSLFFLFPISLPFSHFSNNNVCTQSNSSLECSVLRVIIPNEYNGSIQSKTIPVRPHMTTRDVCRIIAHKSQITNPMDYGLFKLSDGEGKYLIKQVNSSHPSLTVPCFLSYVTRFFLSFFLMPGCPLPG